MQGHKSKNQKGMPKNTLFCHRVRNYGAKELSSDDRTLINSRFWKLSFTERRQWLAAYIDQADVKTKTSQQKDSARLSSSEYLLPLKDDKNVIVCKSMFLSTLGLRSDGMITEMVRAQRQSYDGAIAPTEDRRDSHPPSNNYDAETIRLHINSYNPSISHYKRKNVPNRRYLNPELSIKEMYKNFSGNKDSNKICYKTYCKVFKSENIGFSRPSQDECEISLSYKNHIKDFDHDSDQCAECIAYAKHKVRSTQTRIECQKPIPEEVVCFTADMQRVIVLPKLTTKEHLFVSSLVTFNETFASKTPSKPDYCILLHEAISGRKAPDVAWVFLQLICQCNEDHIWLWADNSSCRNKNWHLFTALAQCVNTWEPETITIKYLEKGHIFMAADAIHENIGKLFHKTSTFATFDDFVQPCEKANNNIKTVVLDLPFIYPISKKARTRSSTKVKMPLMESIAEVQFKKGSSMLHYKESFLEESYTTVNFLQPFLKKGDLKTFPAPSTERRGITKSERDNIINTLEGVPFLLE